jgi:hypothetical protein
MLRKTTVDIFGQSIEIIEASVYRVLKFEKDIKAAEGDQDKILPLILDLVSHCTPLSIASLGENYGLPALIELQKAVITFSTPQREDGLDQAVEAAGKN